MFGTCASEFNREQPKMTISHFPLSPLRTMNQCPGTDELQAMLDGRIAADDLGQLAKHLSDCGACQKKYEELARSLAVLAQGKLALRDTSLVPNVPGLCIPNPSLSTQVHES